MHFHFALGPANHSAIPAPTLLPARGEKYLAEEGDSETEEVESPGPAVPEGMENFQVHQGWVTMEGPPAGQLLAPAPQGGETGA